MEMTYSGILVFADNEVMLKELIAKAQVLAKQLSCKVYVTVIGYHLEKIVADLKTYAIDDLCIFDDKNFQYYRSDIYADAFYESIEYLKPEIVLVGTSDIGKSIACSVATRLHSGVTADCTQLEIEDGVLLQIRPAFGGNIMATIITPNHRPQFATIRQGVFNEKMQKNVNTTQRLHYLELHIQSNIEIASCEKLTSVSSLSDAKLVFVAGNGFKTKQDLDLLYHLADKMGAVVGSTRALVEKGWMAQSQQIGLSGSIINPEVIVTFGVSGSIQFLSGIANCKRIIAINSDSNAMIFKKAHYCIHADLYEIIEAMSK